MIREIDIYINHWLILIMLAHELKAWRETHTYTQKDLAEILGVTVICISRWENGARTIPTFLHLALECMDKKGGEKIERAKKTKMKKKGVDE